MAPRAWELISSRDEYFSQRGRLYAVMRAAGYKAHDAFKWANKLAARRSIDAHMYYWLTYLYTSIFNTNTNTLDGGISKETKHKTWR